MKLLKKVDGVIYLHFILYSERKFIAHRCCQDLSLTSFRSMKTAINESISPCLVGYKMRFDEFNFTLRIMGSQNWWFGDPRTLLNPSIRGSMILRVYHNFNPNSSNDSAVSTG